MATIYVYSYIQVAELFTSARIAATGRIYYKQKIVIIVYTYVCSTCM